MRLITALRTKGTGALWWCESPSAHYCFVTSVSTFCRYGIMRGDVDLKGGRTTVGERNVSKQEQTATASWLPNRHELRKSHYLGGLDMRCQAAIQWFYSR
ncbi:hypothetical protein CSUI_005615 [Cystoisospora suis]|uniref:Uncharacterized protein n=1 Tax=Cystoisospora suis TaxID=483139 RepID=A0A2C6KWX2_9APIC|nr:hypothetical protein CSUI_005615 [Cystoisospora suis]